MDKYYREQLRLLREGAAGFAKEHPALAPMLLAQGGDPDVERILEGTAWLCGQIHRRLDQTAPDLVQSLLRLVFPHAVLPVPSVTLVRFTPQGGLAEPFTVPRGAQIASNPVDGVPCLYGTTHDLRVLPLAITATRQGNGWVELWLKGQAPLRAFLGDSLTLHLAGDYPAAAQRLWALVTRLDHVEAAVGARTATLPAGSVRFRHLPPEDMRLPAGQGRNSAYMELIRYFHFPEQLLSVEVAGLGRLATGEAESEMRLKFCFRAGTDLPGFPDGSFELNVVPAANVFRVAADPLVIDHTREEYLIHPQDGERRFLEILGVVSASARLPGGRALPCRPYQAFGAEAEGLLYTTRFRASGQKGHVEYLLAPLYRFGAAPPERCTLSLGLLCCNHALTGSLRAGDVCQPTDSSPAQARFTNIVAPAPGWPRPMDEKLLWRFLSLMNANLLSLASPEALRSLLGLYVPAADVAPELAAADRRRCLAILGFSAQGEERLFRGRLLRGQALDLTLDPAGFASTGDMWLFANALDRFCAEYAAINSYSRLTLKVAGTGEVEPWPPRLGEKFLI